MKKIFFTKAGNNGATYIFNTKNISSINSSLKFYKSFTIRQKVVKTILFVYLLLNKIFKKNSLKTSDEIVNFLKENTNQNIDFIVNDDYSILISPTRDKIIIHNHDKNSFDKYAFGKSLEGVKNEYNIYKLFKNESKSFNTSKIENFYSDENYCKFTLQNKSFISKSDDLVTILIEFFNLDTKQIKLEDYYENTYKNLDKNLSYYLNILKDIYKNKDIKIGLVHKDFKPWNMNNIQGPLIYDFEESCQALVGEDLLNFYIDPIVSFKSLDEIVELINSNLVQKQLTSYKNKQSLDIDEKIMILNYLFERAYFWNKKNKQNLSSKYLELLKGFLNEK